MMNEKVHGLCGLVTKGLTLLLSLLTVVFCSQTVFAKRVDESYIDKRVQKEIKRQLDSKRPSRANSAMETKIRRQVRQRLRGRLKGHKHHESKVAKKLQPTKHGKKCKDGVYTLPYWPHYSQFYHHNDFLQILAHYDTTSESYSSNGSSQDLSKLLFGQPAIKIKDILLVSKWASEGLLKTAGFLNSEAISGTDPRTISVKDNHFYSILADQEVKLDAHQETFGFALNLARSYRRGSLSIGCHVPLVGKTHLLRFPCNEIDKAKRDQLVAVSKGIFTVRKTDGTAEEVDSLAVPSSELASLDFFAQYDDLGDFFNSILEAKGICQRCNKSTTKFGLGDLSMYVNVDINSRHFAHLLVGAEFVFPTARDRDSESLWDQELGNGGFIQTSAFISAQWEPRWWLNPHVHGKFTYTHAAKVYRRVPRLLKAGADNQADEDRLLCNLILRDNMKFNDDAIVDGKSDLDSTVRGFADVARKIKLHPGPELFIRAGNTFAGLFTKRLFLDIYYDFMARGRTYLSSKTTCGADFDGSVLNCNSWATAHTIAGNFSYQFNKQTRARLGISYIVAGANVPQTFGVDFAFNYEF